MSARSTRSKKRSAGNRSPRRPPPVFFIDQCLGRVDVAEAVRAQGYTAHLLTDRFQPDAPDATWLADVGARRWIVLTKDRHFRKRPVELQAGERPGVNAGRPGHAPAAAAQLTNPDSSEWFPPPLPENTVAAVYRHLTDNAKQRQSPDGAQWRYLALDS